MFVVGVCSEKTGQSERGIDVGYRYDVE